jgi:KTSC domain
MNSSTSPLIGIRHCATSSSDGRPLPTTTMVQSSVLARAAYDQAVAILELEFCSGIVYRYFHVPQQIYQDLLQAHSKGAYFNRHVRNVFRYGRVDSGAPTTALP